MKCTDKFFWIILFTFSYSGEITFHEADAWKANVIYCYYLRIKHENFVTLRTFKSPPFVQTICRNKLGTSRGFYHNKFPSKFLSKESYFKPQRRIFHIGKKKGNYNYEQQLLHIVKFSGRYLERFQDSRSASDRISL